VWNPARFETRDSNCWSDRGKVREFLELLAANQLHLNGIEDWYNVTIKQVCVCDFNFLLN
jgi:hypothetical protein